jgi:hypothetical protein
VNPNIIDKSLNLYFLTSKQTAVTFKGSLQKRSTTENSQATRCMQSSQARSYQYAQPLPQNELMIMPQRVHVLPCLSSIVLKREEHSRNVVAIAKSLRVCPSRRKYVVPRQLFSRVDGRVWCVSCCCCHVFVCEFCFWELRENTSVRFPTDFSLRARRGRTPKLKSLARVCMCAHARSCSLKISCM